MCGLGCGSGVEGLGLRVVLKVWFNCVGYQAMCVLGYLNWGI